MPTRFGELALYCIVHEPWSRSDCSRSEARPKTKWDEGVCYGIFPVYVRIVNLKSRLNSNDNPRADRLMQLRLSKRKWRWYWGIGDEQGCEEDE